METHLNHLSLAFPTLAKEKFYVKFSKCLFGQEQIKYLGHIISCDGVAPAKAK